LRLFFAIDPGADARAAIAHAAEPLRAAAPTGNWSPPERIHLTLKFLGEQDAAMLEPLTAILERVGARHRQFSIGVGGVGAFPSLRAPAVVWMGVRPDPALELLQHDMESACAELGIPVDGRVFRPHVTLGRIPDRTGVNLAALAHAAGGLEFRTEVQVSAVALMVSEQDAGVPRYRTLNAAELAAAS
jgi:RNA 2',3'-cyclic 3'-phosphodiesterase